MCRLSVAYLSLLINATYVAHSVHFYSQLICGGDVLNAGRVIAKM